MEDLEYVEARTKDKHAAAKVLRDAAVETYETLGVGGFDRVRTPTVES